MAIPRNETVAVHAGSVTIGGDAPVSIQTMWKRPLRSEEVSLVLAAIEEYRALGCHLVRFAVPDRDSLGVLGKIAERSVLPVVADIHFDYTLAIACMDTKIAKIRINPGNIGGPERAEEVVRGAAEAGKALRIGINAGSLPADLRDAPNIPVAMVRAAERELEILEKMGFDQAVFSLKSSNIEHTLRANLLFAGRYPYPLHIGITEAGPLIPGIVKNTLGVSRLLEAGVGNTLRVSLSDDPETEIIAARSILSAENLLERGPEIISCPQCGRSTFDVQGFLREHLCKVQTADKPFTLAVMGCAVNGPEEARHADIGITGAGNSVLFFRNGRIVEKGSAREAPEILKRLIEEL
jgi:(E)-4-hydroxy-3-methylbut-2-enyl-diphosphate synthase